MIPKWTTRVETTSAKEGFASRRAPRPERINAGSSTCLRTTPADQQMDGLRSLDCLAGAVLNSYPHVDLPWDNVDCGAMGMAPLNSASASPGPSLTPRRVGTSTICRPGEFSIEK